MKEGVFSIREGYKSKREVLLQRVIPQSALSPQSHSLRIILTVKVLLLLSHEEERVEIHNQITKPTSEIIWSAS